MDTDGDALCVTATSWGRFPLDTTLSETLGVAVHVLPVATQAEAVSVHTI